MNWRSIWAIARKDLIEVKQNKAAWVPAVVVPVMFAIIMPLLFTLVPRFIPVDELQKQLGDVETLLKNLPPAASVIFDGLKLEQMFV